MGLREWDGFVLRRNGICISVLQRSSNFKIKKLITNLNYNIFLELFLNETNNEGLFCLSCI